MNREKNEYLLCFVEDYMDDLIYKVLTDSKTDPHYSAVTASNIIKCYIDVMESLNKPTPYKSVKEYFEFNSMTAEEYELFEKNRKKELEHYQGTVY